MVNELTSLSEIALDHNLDHYKDDLQVYFLQHWTVGKFFALRKQQCISIFNLKFLIVLSEGVTYEKLHVAPNPRIILSFRKRASDDIGFVLVFVDKKGW